MITLDCETNILNVGYDAVGKSKADPFCDKNRIVYLGYAIDDGKVIVHTNKSTIIDRWKFHERDGDLVVGHNLKFDLHYLWKCAPYTHAYMYEKDMRLWDTQLAEYILTGQQTKWATLDQLSLKYGGTVKASTIKEYWNAGIDTPDIPQKEIVPYLIEDVKNTRLIAEQQMEKATELGMMPLMRSQMEALLATTEMSWNGMYFDEAGALEKAADLMLDLEVEEAKIKVAMAMQGMWDANPASNKQVSTYLFGGEYKFTLKEPKVDEHGDTIKYKSGPKKGTVRLFNREVVLDVPALTPLAPEWRTPKGNVQLNEDVLRAVANRDHTLVEFCESVLKSRALNKDINTYYKGILQLTWPDGVVHHTINHTATHTGRTSGEKPNLQNVTGK